LANGLSKKDGSGVESGQYQKKTINYGRWWVGPCGNLVKCLELMRHGRCVKSPSRIPFAERWRVYFGEENQSPARYVLVVRANTCIGVRPIAKIFISTSYLFAGSPRRLIQVRFLCRITARSEGTFIRLEPLQWGLEFVLLRRITAKEASTFICLESLPPGGFEFAFLRRITANKARVHSFDLRPLRPGVSGSLSLAGSPRRIVECYSSTNPY